jgi:hypothetical protein
MLRIRHLGQAHHHEPLLAASLVACLGCSASLGPVASRTLTHEHGQYAGVSTQGIVEVPVLYTKANLALGWESRVLQRTSSSGTSWGDWRLSALIGLSQLPRPHESRLGYEVFLATGAARFQRSNGADSGFLLGLLAAAPVRLSRQLPRWRADQLLAVNFYLVPTLSLNTLHFHELEVAAGLAIRGSLWSSTIP